MMHAVSRCACSTLLKSVGRFALALLLVCSGCGVETAAPPTATPPAGGASPGEPSATAPVAAGEAGTAALPAATTAETPSQATPAPAAGAPAAGSAPQLAATNAPAPAAKPRPTPSPEQLAKWSVPNDPVLQLLACYDFDDFFVQDMAITPDGKQFVLGGSKLTLWTVGKSQPDVDLIANLLDENDVERPILSVGISPDGAWLAAGDQRGKLRVWKLSDLSEAYVVPAHEGRLTELVFSPDSKLLATTSYSGEVCLSQVTDGKKVRTLEVDQQEVSALVFLSDTHLVTAGREVGVWDVESGAKVTTISTEGVSQSILGLTPDRKALLYADGEGRSQGWDADSEKPTGLALSGSGARLIAFSPDGARIATYAGDSTVRLWNAQTRGVTQVLDATGDRTTALQWLPDSSAFVVASEQGRVRIWGTAESAKSLAIDPPSPPTLRESGTSAKRSDSPARFQQVLDFRSFPRLPEARSGYSYGGIETYTAPVAQDEAELFYRHHLGLAGWSELAPPDPTVPGLNFEKDGYALNVRFSPPSPPQPGHEQDLQVNLQFGGNYDARWLPRVAPIDGPVAWASRYLVSYRTKTDLMELEVALLKQLQMAGWTAYSRLITSQNELPDSRRLTFLQSGSELTVSLGYPADSKDEVFVQMGVSVTNKALPIPPDSGWIEFDSSTELRMVATTTLNLQETIQFYDDEMALEGWLPHKLGRRLDTENKRAFLPYFRGQQDVLIRLSSLPDGATRVLVGEAEPTSWQVKNETPADKEESAETPGIEAAEFKLPKGATAIKFDVDAQQIEFELTGVAPQALGELFVKQMEGLAWTRDGAGVLSDDYVFITYTSGKVELQLRATGSSKSSKAIISGDGLLWTKPLPTSPVRVSYETWLRRGGKRATLDHLDTFAGEMRQIPATNRASK
jgi:WD40 repeat protein/catechol 2,3-dioxygenase-like lactoylglutathione lyase family enzyme